MSAFKSLSELAPCSTLPQEDLVRVLKEQPCTFNDLKKMGATELQVTDLRQHYRLMYQYDNLRKDFIYYIVEKGENPYSVIPCAPGQKKLRVAALGDLHIGSNEVNCQELIMLLTYLQKRDYKVITISGDLTDGLGVYRGQTQNLDLATAEKQAELFVSIFSQFNFDVYACWGNHDEAASGNGAVRVLSLIEEKMANRKKGKNKGSFTVLKSFTGYLVWGKNVIGISHMDGSRGNGQSDTYPFQKVMDNMFKSSMGHGEDANYVNIHGHWLPLVKLVLGHYHGPSRFRYGNVVCEAPLTLQHTTDFINRRGIYSKTGCRVFSLNIDDNGNVVSDKGAIIFGNDVEDIFNIERRFKGRTSRHQGMVVKPEPEPTLQGVVDNDKVNTALKKLFQRGYVPMDELGLTDEEITGINQQFHYNIYVENGVVVLKTDDDYNTVIRHSLLPESGIVHYLELSRLWIGSKFFHEPSLRSMLDKAREQGVQHIHLGGDIVWGIPKKNEAQYTTLFSSEQQIEAVVNILKDYPEFHYYSINGMREQSFIRAKSESQRINPLLEVSQRLQSMGIQFISVNSSKCDFVVFGTVFRMINLQKTAKTPYTRDVEIINAQRALMTSMGNHTDIDGTQYPIGAIFYGSVASTLESHYGGMYTTSTSGSLWDAQGEYPLVQAKPEGRIVSAFISDGRLVKFTSNILSPM